MWKVYHIQTGKLICAGFDDEDKAKDWLERRRDISDDDHETEEMDEEEELEYLEAGGADEDDFEAGSERMPEPLYHNDDDDNGDDDDRGTGSESESNSEFEGDESGYNLVDDEDL
jgi:hypothetical protein